MSESTKSQSAGLPPLCAQFVEHSLLPMAGLEGRQHIVRYTNTLFCALIGRSHEAIIGRPFAEAVPAGAAYADLLDRVYLTGIAEAQSGAPQPPLYWLLSLWPVKGGDGDVQGVMFRAKQSSEFHWQATAMNQALMQTAVRYHELKESLEKINGQLQTQIAVRQAGEVRLLKTLRDLSELKAAVDEHAIVAITDPNGIITYANDKFCSVSKYSLAELLGQDHRLISSGTHSKEFFEELWTTIARGDVWKGEIKGLAKDGTPFWLETTIVPFLDAAGAPVQYVTIRTDVTALKNSESALRESQRLADQASRAKDEFIAALSHELRTPLTPVLLIVSALEGDCRLAPELRAQIKDIRQNVELEAALIDDLLDVTRIKYGKLLLRPVRVDVQQLLSRALRTLDHDIYQKRIALTVHAEARHFHVMADPTRIQQVFWNVLKNAVKFTPEGGNIEVRTFNSDDLTLQVEIRDNGIGIPPECIPSLFTPFEQGAVAGIHRFGGLGLGLSIAKSILELHGGNIAASSAGAGQGATFTIGLPVVTAQESAAAPPAGAAGNGPAHLHILLVEDHAQTRAVLTRLLSREGHDVEAVSTCEAAIQAAKAAGNQGANLFQAIVSDLALPDGSGLNLIRSIKAQFPAINAVAVSGYGSEDDIRRSTEAGFNHHLVKPIAVDALRHALAA